MNRRYIYAVGEGVIWGTLQYEDGEIYNTTRKFFINIAGMSRVPI